MNVLAAFSHQVSRSQGSQVLQQMPDPQKSVEMAFQMSFGSRSWSDVLEYVLDTNAYLEKQFLNIFHQQKRSFVGAARSRVEKRVFSAYHLLQDARPSERNMKKCCKSRFDSCDLPRVFLAIWSNSCSKPNRLSALDWGFFRLRPLISRISSTHLPSSQQALHLPHVGNG